MIIAHYLHVSDYITKARTEGTEEHNGNFLIQVRFINHECVRRLVAPGLSNVL